MGKVDKLKMKKAMFRYRIVVIVVGLICFTSLYGQEEYYNIKFPGQTKTKKCKDCNEIMKNKPVEVQFALYRDVSNVLYFHVTHKEWFDKMFKKNSDGIAIDIVNKKRYACTKDKPERKSTIIGDLQQPVYRKELKSKMLPSHSGEVIIKLGTVPGEFLSEEVEFNLVILKKKYLCYYNSFVDLETSRWELLDMGMYLDTLTYKDRFDSDQNAQERYILNNKRLRFEIPFEKNKSEYTPNDIKPLYDSLRLTDFTIRKITIKAYSSVEGNTKRNKELQKQRAGSIVEALQEFQEPEIENEIIVSENWVEFLNDITLSEYAYLTELSREEIKEKLKNRSVSNALEPYLKNHRKAVVIMELQKRHSYGNISNEGLVELFQKSIAEKNLEQAIEIQNSIFNRISKQKAPSGYLNGLEIPGQIEYGTLLNRNTMFNYMLNEIDIYSALLELEKLEDILPNDAHIKYNIVALKFRIWLMGEQAIEPVDFKQEINSLKKLGIPNSLVKRMLINYNIVMSEYYMINNDFQSKDKALRYIYSNYKYLPLTDTDYLRLAQYFSSYAKYDWAIKLLAKKAKQLDVDEDLLFYYLNLTLNKPGLTKKTVYKVIIQNAININPERYCKLFDPYGEGGISFQLLESNQLRQTYCENCSQ